MNSIQLIPILGIPQVQPGDVLAEQIIDAATPDPGLLAGDVIVVTQKVVSKAEDRFVSLAKPY